ncbi:MAG: alpha-L-fucosidase [Clostridia bacterium]|nr:alpha-L-fucosidase [Clostridia bacterium]
MDILNNSWCVKNNGFAISDGETERLISVLPSERQLEFMKMEYYNFIHFGINTFYGREWGDGKEDISRFCPARLDTDQWCSVLKSTGSKGVIITAKHHDGFCLFDTAYTKHNVMNTPFGKDIVRLLSESCKKYDMKLGIYLSPWDRHESTYGTDEYNDYFVGQLRELCTNYGELFCLWFDGACGEGANGKKQVYDWDRYYAVIRELQPKAVISVCGPDVRWIGNEGGRVRKSEWSVIPYGNASNDKIMNASQQTEAQAKELAVTTDRDEDLGSRELLSKYRDLVFKPAEADVSINLGWFYHPDIYYLFKKNRTAKDLAEIYFNSVGGNASMLLNVPPDKHGLISKREIRTLKEFTRLITEPFEKEVKGKAVSVLRIDNSEREAQGNEFDLAIDEAGLKVRFSQKERVSLISLKENLRFGQRIEKFSVYAKNSADGSYYEIYSGTVIGSRKIARLKQAVDTDEILIVPTQSRGNPVLCDVRIYA